MTINPLLHNDCIATFKREFYRELLTSEHVKGGQRHIQKLTFPDGGVEESANFWGWELEKDNVKYLLPATDGEGKEVKLIEVLPFFARDTQKVAFQGVAYLLVQRPVTAKFRPLQTMSFRALVDKLSSLKHSNPLHQKLMWFMAFSQMYERSYYRIATPPGFGKDSVVDIVGSILGKAATIENPTLAKLEERSIHLKWLAINEVVDLSAEAWKIIEQFLLPAASHKMSVTKHSKAHGNVGEELDLSQFSISILYNDIDCYPDSNKYVDFVAKGAVIDRFPALRLYGNFTEDFNEIRSLNVKEYVTSHMHEYRDIISAFEYYRLNMPSCMHHYNTAKMDLVPGRDKTNIGKLLSIIDLYCDTQTEFDSWIQVIIDSKEDYKEMLVYPSLLEKAKPKVSSRDLPDFTQKLKYCQTYKEKNKMLRQTVNGEVDYNPDSKHNFW
jgi:hypothetical protein